MTLPGVSSRIAAHLPCPRGAVFLAAVPPPRFFVGCASSQLTAITSRRRKKRNVLMTRNIEKPCPNSCSSTVPVPPPGGMWVLRMTPPPLSS